MSIFSVCLTISMNLFLEVSDHNFELEEVNS